MDAILALEGADRLHDIPEEFTQVLRRLANFGGVLRLILQDRPEIDQRALVNISQVHHK